MATISPASSDRMDSLQPTGEPDTWSTVPLKMVAPSSSILYAVPVRRAIGSSLLPQGSLLAVLLALFAVLNLGDLASTYIGLSHGLNEGNPLMSHLLALYGFGALITDKVLVVATVTGGTFLLRRFSSRMANLVTVACDGLVLVVVLSNLVQYALIR